MNDDRAATTTPRRDRAVVDVDLDGHAVIYDPRGGEVFELDAIGSWLWCAFDGRVTLAELVDELTETFGESRDTVADAVLVFVADLGADGLLEVDAPIVT